jgi:hypothetical protein
MKLFLNPNDTTSNKKLLHMKTGRLYDVVIFITMKTS